MARIAIAAPLSARRERKSMIITRLAGGIGNQMFHYAIARKHQRSDSERIVLDTRLLKPLESDIEKIIQRPYALGIFRNLVAEAIDTDMKRLLDSMKFLVRVRRRLFMAQTHIVNQQFLQPVSVGTRRARHLWLIGNFQSEQHFGGIREKLLHDFEFPPLDEKNAAVETKIQSNPQSVSIHIRRGDYLSSSNRSIFDSVTPDYYQEALKRLTATIPASSLTGFVFSDDIEWAKANLSWPGLRLEYVTGNDGHNSWKDMSLMSRCRHHIIANSSFSWWGAWLSRLDGQNYAPMHWFRPESYPYDINHIAPGHWHVVDYKLD